MFMTLSDYGIIGQLAELFAYFSEFFYGFYLKLFGQTVGDVIVSSLDLIALPDIIADLPLLNVPFGSFIIGSGLSLYLGYQLIKYLLDIIF